MTDAVNEPIASGGFPLELALRVHFAAEVDDGFAGYLGLGWYCQDCDVFVKSRFCFRRAPAFPDGRLGFGEFDLNKGAATLTGFRPYQGLHGFFLADPRATRSRVPGSIVQANFQS